jgi:hypothetical protein
LEDPCFNTMLLFLGVRLLLQIDRILHVPMIPMHQSNKGRWIVSHSNGCFGDWCWPVYELIVLWLFVDTMGVSGMLYHVNPSLRGEKSEESNDMTL